MGDVCLSVCVGCSVLVLVSVTLVGVMFVCLLCVVGVGESGAVTFAMPLLSRNLFMTSRYL